MAFLFDTIETTTRHTRNALGNQSPFRVKLEACKNAQKKTAKNYIYLRKEEG